LEIRLILPGSDGFCTDFMTISRKFVAFIQTVTKITWNLSRWDFEI